MAIGRFIPIDVLHVIVARTMARNTNDDDPRDALGFRNTFSRPEARHVLDLQNEMGQLEDMLPEEWGLWDDYLVTFEDASHAPPHDFQTTGWQYLFTRSEEVKEDVVFSERITVRVPFEIEDDRPIEVFAAHYDDTCGARIEADIPPIRFHNPDHIELIVSGFAISLPYGASLFEGKTRPPL